MISPAVFRSTDFILYQQLLSDVLPANARIAVTDEQGTQQLGDADFPLDAAKKILEVTDTNTNSNALEGAAQLVAIGSETLCFVGQTIEALQQHFFLWALIPQNDRLERYANSLSLIAKLIAHKLQQDIELDAMATELTERYEELNLVYHTEDHVSDFSDGHDALNALVSNCREYLDVNLAAVIMRDRQIEVACDQGGIADSQWDGILEQIESSIYDAVMLDRSELILNKSDANETESLWPFDTHRLLAAPILDGKGAPSGIIALVNTIDHGKFNNSDKNLLRVMARKTGKIVQVGYDVLTGLVNREGLEFCIESYLSSARSVDIDHALLLIDIDKLQVINDTVGAEAGDHVIKSIAAQLRSSVRESDIVSRYGGDVFAVLLEGCPLPRAGAIAEKIRESIVNLHIPWNDRILSATVSIGVAPITADSESASDCLVSAELARDAAKELGTNRVHCFAPHDTGLIRRHQEMETIGDIQTALKDGLFELFAQPIAPAVPSPSREEHIEILLRLRNDEGEIISPADFLPAAERYHLMPDIDRWVVSNTLAFLDEHATSLALAIGKVGINLSGQSLNETGFLAFIESALENSAWPKGRLYFEITETAAVQDLELAREFISRVKAHGCQFALDDFGSGLSSFGYLQSLPVDYLKIDGSICKGIDHDPVVASMVNAVKQVADVMGIETVAEYVETEAIKQKLIEIGITYLQGWAIGKPRSVLEYIPTTGSNREAVTQ